MVNPQFVSEEPVSLVEVQTLLAEMEKRDGELNQISQKTKDYVDGFVTLSHGKRNELVDALTKLDLTRLKQEHIIKIVDFLPQTTTDLKVVLQAYPLSLPKKDQDAIVATVKAAL